MLDHFNHGVDASVPPIPQGVGDYFYGQDQSADFWYLSDLATRFRDVFSSYPVLVSGGVVSVVTNWQVNITPAKAIANFLVNVRDTTQVWGVPPQMRQEAVAAFISLPLQSGLDVHSGGTMNPTANGTTPNYLCLSYAESTPSNGTRAKVKKAGSYAYAKAPSFSLSCGPTNPAGDDTKVLLAVFTVTAAGVITITNQARKTAIPPAISSIYTQFPNQDDPATLWPGTTWSNISSSYPGAFFRAEGGSAQAFAGQAAAQAGQNKQHDHGGASGGMSANNPHNHSIPKGSTAGGTPYVYGCSNFQSDALTANSTNIAHTHSISADGGTEARPDNWTVRIWKRTA